MNKTKEQIVEEFKKRAKFHTFNLVKPPFAYENVDMENAGNWLIGELTQLEQQVRKEERDRIHDLFLDMGHEQEDGSVWVDYDGDFLPNLNPSNNTDS